jgi:hypothetical protein
MHASEIDITDFFNDAAPSDYSASALELGQDAGKITWSHACEDSAGWPLLANDEQREQFRRYVKGFGAWTDAEIAAWSDTELNALLIQLVSGDIREMRELCGDSWAEYGRLAERGTVCGCMGPGADGRIYYSISE